MPDDHKPIHIDLQPTNENDLTHLLDMIPSASPRTSECTKIELIHDWDSSMIGPASLRSFKRRSRSCSSIDPLLDSNRTSTLLHSLSPAKLVPVMENLSANISLCETNEKTLSKDSVTNSSILSSSPTKQIDDSTTSLPTEDQLPMLDFIREIMSTYKDALDNLTHETKQLREELEDQKQQMKNK